jgi:hypothetical protein
MQVSTMERALRKPEILFNFIYDSWSIDLLFLESIACEDRDGIHALPSREPEVEAQFFEDACAI